MIDEPTLDRIVEFHGHLCPWPRHGRRRRADRVARDRPARQGRGGRRRRRDRHVRCRRHPVPHRLHVRQGQPHPPGLRQERLQLLPPLRRPGHPHHTAPGRLAADPEHQALFAKVRSGEATDAEKARFRELHVSQSHKVLGLDPDSLYAFEVIHGTPPRKARIHNSITCAECGEAAMETRIRRLDGRDLCQPCFDLALSPVQPVVMRGPGR